MEVLSQMGTLSKLHEFQGIPLNLGCQPTLTFKKAAEHPKDFYLVVALPRAFRALQG